MKGAWHVRRSRLLPSLDLARSVRKISREVGLGVAEALQEAPAPNGGAEEPGWRAERLALGASRGIDHALEDDHLRRTIASALEDGIETAFAAALAQSAMAQELSEDAARAFARGALAELRTALGTKGAGPLTRSLSASTRRVAREAANAVVAPMLLCAIAVVVGFTGALFLRRAPRRRRGLLA